MCTPLYNENIVFILNAQTMSAMQTYSRNRLFTAMTRAKFKVYISMSRNYWEKRPWIPIPTDRQKDGAAAIR